MDTTPVSNSVWTHAEPLTVEIPQFSLEDFQKAYDWKYRGIPVKQRPMSFEAFVTQSILDGGKKQAEYVDNQAYNAMEKLCFQRAKLENISPLEAAGKMGFQLKES